MSDDRGEIVYVPPQGNPFQDQATFMEACGQTTTEPNHLQTKLYERLIDEEYIEFKSAKTAAEEADAVIDLIVVLIGYGFSRGWPMQALWNCVHATNIAKIDPETGKVRRREDGKVLKPIDWTPPNIEALIG
jgi:hypothetical protein